MKLTCVFLPLLFAVTACTDTKGDDALGDAIAADYEAAADNLEAMSDDSESSQMPAQRPHNYSFKEGELYGYIAAVPEEERKTGKAAGDIVMFAYGGLKDGTHQIESLNDSGEPVIINECGVPCVAIKSRTVYSGRINRMEYNPRSLLGAAFEDAMNGYLTPRKRAPAAVNLSPPTDVDARANNRLSTVESQNEGAPVDVLEPVADPETVDSLSTN